MRSHGPINAAADLEVLNAGEPYLRSILAFLLYLRYTGMEFESSYNEADRFINRLQNDVSDADPTRTPPK